MLICRRAFVAIAGAGLRPSPRSISTWRRVLAADLLQMQPSVNNLLNFSLLTRDRPAGPAVGCVGWAGERLSASPSSAPLPCEEGGWGGRFRVRAHSLLRFGAGHAPRLFTLRCPARREGPPVT